MTGEAIIVALATVAATTLVQAVVGWVFRSAVVQVRDDNAALKQQIKALEETRIARLEAKDARDTESRSAMHKDVDRLTVTVTKLEAVVSAQQTVQVMIKSEIDRSIAAGNARVERLETRLDELQTAVTADVKALLERVQS